MTTEREQMQMPALLVLLGLLTHLGSGLFHPDRVDANDHARAFAEYAASPAWIAVHAGQFLGMAMLLVGLVGVLGALRVETKDAAITRMAMALAVAALAIYGVLQGVDGVALKHAVDAWSRAPTDMQADRFAAAEAVRWLEWGARSYFSFCFGLALIASALSLARSSRPPLVAATTMALWGVAYIAQGWVIGAVGFASQNAAPTLAGYALALASAISLTAHAFRRA